MSDADCIFCSIAAGTQPATVVDRDDHTMAFMDINPWARGHAVVVPRHHARDLHEIDPADLVHAMLAAKRLAARMTERLDCEGVTLWNSCGEAAGQVMPHFHIHVIPRYAGDPPIELRPREHPAEQELARVAEQLQT